MRYGYYTDLRGLTFAEGKSSWITAMRVGDYKHPMYGEIKFTLDRLQRFAESVKNKVRGIDLDIDYDHKQDIARGGEAAGWVRDARVEGDTLQLLVEWTETAAQKIKEKAYRYFSPEFQDEWVDSTGKKFQDVLFGGGITNRPFLKDLLPVNLNELTFAEQKKQEGNQMDRKELAKLLGLPEDTSEEQIKEHISSNKAAAQNKLGTPPDSTATTHAPNSAATTNANGTIGGLPYDATTAGQVDKDGNAITPEDVQLNELAKTNPALAFMLREQMKSNKALTERLARVEQENKIAGISLKLNEYRSGNTVVAPAVLDEAAKLLAKTPVTLHEDVHALLKLIQGGKTTVQLGEQGHSGNVTGNVNGKTAMQEVEERITATRKKFNENGGTGELAYADALTQVFREDPELFSRYQEEAYAFKA